MPRNAPSARSRASAMLRRRRPSVMMIASSAHRIATHDRPPQAQSSEWSTPRNVTAVNSASGMVRPCSGPARSRDRRRALTSRVGAEVVPWLGAALGLNYLSAGLIHADEAMAEPDLGKGTTYENRRRVPLRLHQGRRPSGPGEDHGLPLHGLPIRH